MSASGNVGNHIRSTPSVKLHAPPGGASSISLGWDTSAAPEPSRYGRRAAVTTQAPVAAPVAVENYAPVAASRAECAPVVSERTSSNAYASGANQNCGNFLTDRRTTRVAAPPGGRSSFTLG